MCFIDRRLSCAAPAHPFPDIGNEVHTLPQVGKGALSAARCLRQPVTLTMSGFQGSPSKPQQALAFSTCVWKAHGKQLDPPRMGRSDPWIFAWMVGQSVFSIRQKLYLKPSMGSKKSQHHRTLFQLLILSTYIPGAFVGWVEQQCKIGFICCLVGDWCYTQGQKMVHNH